MSIRITVCLLFVLAFSVYAWRNWFASLCAAVLLMAVIEHPDMPRNIGGIQGLNPWNILMLNVLSAWVLQPRDTERFSSMPRSFSTLLLAYMAVVFLTTVRLFWTRERYDAEYSTTYILSEHLINCFKWVLPGLLLYDGCRTPQRMQIAIAAVFVLYVLLAIQVIRWMPLSFAMASGDTLSGRASKLIQNEIGYNRVTLSNMLGGASWAILGTYVVFRKRLHRLGVLTVAGMVAMAQALTGGRSGYASWAIVGLILCLVRWRWMLPIMAGTALAVLTLLPGVRERLLQGFGGLQGNIVIQSDDYEITSGRTIAWPYVIRQIAKGPIVGFGREAMVTTGIRDRLMDEYGESFPHPHNAYLESLLDSGVVGFLPILAFYLLVLRYAFPLLLDRQDPLCAAVGGMGCALVLALLVGSLGGQTFYPREGAVGMWCAIFLVVRVWVEREQAMVRGLPLFTDEPQSDTPHVTASFQSA